MMDYIGNPLQVRGVEQYSLQNSAKGDGMKFLNIRNGLGLECWISLDRAGDVSRVSFKGENMSYFAPCGYVAPQYYDGVGAGFLKSFTAGFFTTCGLTAVGSPCEDDGEQLGLHGTVSNIPATIKAIEEDENGVVIKLCVVDATIFGRKLELIRTYNFSYKENSFSVSDTVTNKADTKSPFMILYHCNMGYPLLSEKSLVKIPNNSVVPRNEHAAEFIERALEMEQPQSEYEECCYFYDVKEKSGFARAGIYNEDIKKGVVLIYDKTTLPCFTEWKMMGKTDYVLGLEPANCTPDGRNVLRENGTLKFLNPNQSVTTGINFKFVENQKNFEEEF